MTENPEMTPEYIAELRALYVEFVTSAAKAQVGNTVVARAAIMMLVDALGNMANATPLPHEHYSAIAGEAVTYLNGVSMDLSHEMAAAVVRCNEAMAGEGSNVIQMPTAADASTAVEN